MIVKASDWIRPELNSDSAMETNVRAMLLDCQQRSALAINEYSEKFDGFKPRNIELKPFDEYELDAELKVAIRQAAKRIKRFARFQNETLISQQFSDSLGEYSQVITPIERAGCYIPGGRFPLISTALMTLIPAKVAGCHSRVAVSPSDHPALLAAASLAGATQFVQIGGVQAIAALAYGYESIEPVDIVVGPGNAYVNEAKAQLQRKVKIDGLAGPSEMLALCDSQQPIEWLALDALAQSEHDPMALSVLVSDNESWLTKVATFLQHDKKYEAMVNNKQIALVLAKDVNDMIAISENFAPEHLMLCDKRISAKQLSHFGSLFVGANSAVAMGDYCSGPNHTLPTIGYARQSGGLNVQTFQRIQTVQAINDNGRIELANLAMPIAKEEGLKFHYQSLKVRL
ncbi:histidinol dehydrogenase [Pleionea mediterranea]|uniref:Histidinol dehydrogenase/sulfopropanediol 3-dehydrogenase n=1 Tax=Pleionea mediterranea TaxID=523701 RepID=A0A316FPE0_9GAMM|nr:histidinol dehydrogenase [Pleionea mediterranea]PWK50718.1 histidinol dehydrogenase/sulfopropanediol 3-dehydrogenase [Pleionea mediterranea]